jgi:hypothetical protein
MEQTTQAVDGSGMNFSLNWSGVRFCHGGYMFSGQSLLLFWRIFEGLKTLMA